MISLSKEGGKTPKFQILPRFFINSCCGRNFDLLLSELSSIIPIANDKHKLINVDNANMLVIIGPINNKMLKEIIVSFEQMLAPKLVVTVGDCTMVQGILENSDSLVRVSNYIDVSKHIPGCPPTINDIVMSIKQLLAETIK